MYRLSIDIDTDDRDILIQLQQEISLGLSKYAQATSRRIGYSFTPIEDLGEIERRNTIRDTMAGVASPPPNRPMEELELYISDWEEYKNQRNGDFIEEEEMEL